MTRGKIKCHAPLWQSKRVLAFCVKPEPSYIDLLNNSQYMEELSKQALVVITIWHFETLPNPNLNKHCLFYFYKYLISVHIGTLFIYFLYKICKGVFSYNNILNKCFFVET